MLDRMRAWVTENMEWAVAWTTWFCGWLAETILALGYPGIVFLMAVESSLVPFPSEIIMPPAGYLIHEGKMTWALVIFSGVLGSVLGALFNYYLALWLGRPFLIRYGKYFFLKPDTLEKAEAFFAEHGEITTFVGRLVPVIRQVISLPAGLARMNLAKFTFYTGLGALIWVSILTWAGWLVGRNQELVHQYMRSATLWVLGAAAVLVVAYIKFYQWRKARRLAAATAEPE